MKKVVILVLITLFPLFFPSSTYAKKKISRLNTQKTTSLGELPWTKLKLRVDKNALIMALGNLNLSNQVDYTLTYTSADVGQGVSGSLDPSKPSQQKEFLFGTCSGTNCTYHREITNMIFEIVFKLTSGQTLTRRYQITP